MSAVDQLAALVRAEILGGALPPGKRLREVDLAERHSAARHTVRAALRALEGEGLVVVEPNRGARVVTLKADDIVALYQLRTALEVEAAHLALARHGGRLPAAIHDAADALARACTRARPKWAAVTEAHAALHHAVVVAARSPRIERAHAALTTETHLFLQQVRPHYTYEALADEHLALAPAIERDGPEVLRVHLHASASLLVDAL